MPRSSFKCRVCSGVVNQMDSIIKKSVSMSEMCCSLACFKLTSEYRENRRVADLARIAKIRESGSFERNGLASKLTRARKFLESHGFYCEGMCDEEILSTWKREFKNRSGHGEKIAAGRLQKYGDTEAILRADRERAVKASCTILGIDYRKDFSSEKKKLITKAAYRNFRVKDKTSWKLKHLLKHTNMTQVADLTQGEIDKLYSEYISDRFTRASIETDRNGYTRSEKGWYFMTNQADGKFFYRSSWEKKVFEALDHLVGAEEIHSVFAPDRIQYELDGVKRHYYPDAAFVTSSGSRVILEIKPARKVDDACNAVKIASARDKIGSNFHVLTEHEIFHSDLTKILGEM